jgi:hypothetical protein
MYRQVFNIQMFYILPTECTSEAFMDLSANNDYFPTCSAGDRWRRSVGPIVWEIKY